MELDLHRKVIMFLFSIGLILGVIVSSDAQDTSRMKCGSVNVDDKDCLTKYIDDKFEQLASKHEQSISEIEEKLTEQGMCASIQKPRNCHELYTQGHSQSGIYSIFVPDCVETSHGRVCEFGETHIRVYCDMGNDFGGPGWIVFQRRQDGSVNFTRDWNTYKNGFGDLFGELWLGNDNIAKITASGNFQLRIDLCDWNDECRYAEYSFICVLSAEDKYQLFFGDYSGDSGDAFGYSGSTSSLNATYFSTIDQDNDRESSSHCALQWWNAGFWYSNCGAARLNNPYRVDGDAESGKGIMWYTGDPSSYVMKSTVMKIRPMLN